MSETSDILHAAGEVSALMRGARSAVVLTGAGVSTASGIPDFRGPSGLYSIVSPRTFEIDFFRRQPEQYYEIAIKHIHPLADKIPNIIHTLLAEMEQHRMIRGVITQNIDALHQKAGSKHVVEFHGNVMAFSCTDCQRVFDRAAVEEKILTHKIPYCSCGWLIRPNITFFGDMIDTAVLDTAQEWAQQADIFIAMGSSLTVQPAASLPVMAKECGATLIIVNQGDTPLDDMADFRYGCCLEAFAEAMRKQLQFAP